MQHAKRIFITGTNRGLGVQLVKLLSKKNPQIQLHISSRKSPTELAHQWESHIPNHHLKCYQIDLNSPESIQTAAENIRKSHIQFDLIVANAAYGADYGTTIPSYQIAHSTLTTNVDSTISFVKAFIPLLTNNGRVIIVSSIMGTLTAHSQRIRNALTNPNITEEEILAFSRQYVDGAKNKYMKDFHWSAYRTSKALINTWGRFILPNYLKQEQTGYCIHPGWCRTDMGGQGAPLSAQDGASLIYNSFWVKQVEKGRFYNNKFCSYVQCE